MFSFVYVLHALNQIQIAVILYLILQLINIHVFPFKFMTL